ncbi:hypothetical protein TrCOL_g8198 [Triparma columacea]|uniref:Uncharacterized protein n=1 Tax=Triparma columacea TaxID=722753 RepID=A0A9W7GCM0_9STRA|nr:hypothetical protein TrCOL_g8198 [Triparma columacea]
MEMFGIRASRREVNFTYVLWVQGVCTTLLQALEVVVGEGGGEMVPEGMEGANRKGMVVFMAANLGTGAVNLICQTERMDKGEGMMVMAMYLAAIFGISRYGVGGGEEGGGVKVD